MWVLKITFKWVLEMKSETEDQTSFEAKKYLLKSYDVLDTILGTRDIAVAKNLSLKLE